MAVPYRTTAAAPTIRAMTRLLRSTAVVGGMTLVSRLLGYLRDVVLAISFGASGATDAFFVAFRIPNFFRRIVGEGAFAQAFVPVFAEYHEKRGPDETRDMADHVAGALGLALFVLTVIGVVAAPVFITVFAPGFTGENGRADLAADLLRITFPYILFISLTAMAGGILNSLGRFAIPAVTPALLNLTLIAAALWGAPHFAEPVTALAWGVFAAGVLQLGFQLPFLNREGLLPRPRLDPAHEAVRRVMRLMAPVIVGSSATQINTLVNTMIASLLMTGSISWLYYSDRFVELPHALIGVAIGTVILPHLSRRFSQGSSAGFGHTMDWALRLSLAITIPATVGLVALAGPILAALVQYREFSAFDTRMATAALMTYGLGLPAFVLVKILAPAFYARQDTKTPVRSSLIAIGANLALNALIVIPWVQLGLTAPHAGLALATALAAYVNAGLLARYLRRDGIPMLGPDGRRLVLRVIAASLAMGVMLFLSSPPLDEWSRWDFGERAWRLAALIALGCVTFAVAAFGLGARPRDLYRAEEA